MDEKEEDVETAELFEHAYNYRYQEPHGSEILSYGREILDTVRRVDERRKKKRERLKLRKLEENKVRMEELKRIKEIKVKDANEKLKLLSKVTGIPLAKLDVNLDAPFNSELHEIEMEKMLGHDYYKQPEELKGKALLADDILEINQVEMKPEPNNKERNGISYGVNEADLDENEYVWWICDYCGGGILEGHKRFDCEICDNYTLCKACVPLANHKHKLIRKKVSKGHQPPPEFTSSTKMEKNLMGLMDDSDNFEYEDIIGGDLPVRFKYRKVRADNLGLSIEQVLSSEDKELKNKCSIRKLLAYTH